MLRNLNGTQLEAVIKNATTDPDVAKITSAILQDNPALLDSIIKAVGQNAEATQMLGRAVKTLK